MGKIEEDQFSDADENNVRQNTFKGEPIIDVTPLCEKLNKMNLKKDSEIENENNCHKYNDYDWHSDDTSMGHKCRFNANKQTTNAQGGSSKITSYTPTNKPFRRYANKINIDDFDLNEKNRFIENNSMRIKDKINRITAVQVVDKQTEKILCNFIKIGIIHDINGSIHTGKEANVYHAKSKTNIEFAIKIYKTSALVSKDRDKYISGNYCLRRGYSRSHSKKMIERPVKEFLNLHSLQQKRIKAPKPIYLKSPILLMDFIGKDGVSCPKLKDAVLQSSEPKKLYRECIVIMWQLYNKCKLVHADLSEYNILYQDGTLVIIDVSQLVEQDHPRALEFLTKDCINITEFFRKHNVAVMPVQTLLDMIINKKNIDECLDIRSKMIEDEPTKVNPEQQSRELLKNAHGTQNLFEVIDNGKDTKLAKAGKEDLLYKTLVGLREDLCPEILVKELQNDKTKTKKETKEEKQNENSDDDSGQSEDTEYDKSENESGRDHKSKFVNSARPKHETTDERKARKRALKEQKANNRKTKIKKHVKKQKTKQAKKI